MIHTKVFLAFAALVSIVNAGTIGFYSTPSIKFGVPATSAWDICPYGETVPSYSFWYKANDGATGIRLQCSVNTEIKITSKAEKNMPRTQETPTSACSGGFDGAQVYTIVGSGITTINMWCGDSSVLTKLPAGANELSGQIEGAAQNCSVGHKICGVRTEVDASVGLTGLEFLCCATAETTDGDIQNVCDFGTDLCGWTNSSKFATKKYNQTYALVPDGNYLDTFHRTNVPANQESFATGPAVGTPGYWVSYESAVDGPFSVEEKNIAFIRRFNSPTYDAAIWRDVRFQFEFMAYGRGLGKLYLQVRDTSDAIFQEQMLFDSSRSPGETYQSSDQIWHTLSFGLYVNGTSFSLSFEVRDGKAGQSGEFAFDNFTMINKNSGTCNNTGCHENATCTDDLSLATGFTCKCFYGFTGDGMNSTGSTGCTEINQCQDIPNLCNTTDTINLCHQLSPGNYTCACDDTGYEADANSTACLDIDECTANGADWCGMNATCTNTPGNYSCACDAGFTDANSTSNEGNPQRNLTCDANGGWTAWSVAGSDCSVTCGGGVYNSTRNCTNPEKVGVGLDCEGPSYNETARCNEGLCPTSCPVWKNCSACGNYTDFAENGPLNMTLTYFSGLSANDLTFAMTKLSQWNQTVVDEVCQNAYCDVAALNTSITAITADSTTVNTLSTSVTAAKLMMRDILDCNKDTVSGHNLWLWNIFDKLCEYEAFLPHIYEDLSIKTGMLTAERDRCAGRSNVRSLLELMYRKW